VKRVAAAAFAASLLACGVADAAPRDNAPPTSSVQVAAVATGWTGRWLAEDINGGGVLDRTQTMIELAADGRVTGSGGCNRIFGTAKIEGDTIAFGAMGATRMACPPAVMAQEAKFLDALRDARAWRVDELRRKLSLLDARGRALVVFARM
jgi:heat shock protein HslJ